MAFFTTRVEFNGDYPADANERLNASMAASGFLRTGVINSIEFKLPTGEFFCTSDAEIAVVANIAINLARIVWYDASVLVTKADGEPYSMGLKPVETLPPAAEGATTPSEVAPEAPPVE